MKKIEPLILKKIFEYSFKKNRIKYNQMEEINNTFKLSFNNTNDCNLFMQDFENSLQTNIRNFLMLEGLNYKEFKRDIIYSTEMKEVNKDTILFINY